MQSTYVQTRVSRVCYFGRCLQDTCCVNPTHLALHSHQRYHLQYVYIYMDEHINSKAWDIEDIYAPPCEGSIMKSDAFAWGILQQRRFGSDWI
jgi:hypothetical protein